MRSAPSAIPPTSIPSGTTRPAPGQKDDGIRIDHLLLSPQAADRLIDAGIDRHVRSWDKPSDHVPVYVDLDIEAR